MNATHRPSGEKTTPPGLRGSVQNVNWRCIFAARLPIQICPRRVYAICFLSGDSVKLPASENPGKREGLGFAGETVHSCPSFPNKISFGVSHSKPLMSEIH